ncbi:SAGA-associated factor 29 [Copidosoma floridanum]|uniref:SAGA-associated factor 29 n=1 Tax=Copidosoma floridanum TaxID=29053 RepID=UPI000C6F8265|nr:SAGA-associated factor 29 [Copidosoma floridanum]
MPFTADAAAYQIQERLKSINQLVHDVEKAREHSEVNLNNITKTQEKVNADEKISPFYQQKLKSQYSSAVVDAQQEEDLLRKALEKINEIRSIRNERKIQSGLGASKLVQLFGLCKDDYLQLEIIG